MTKSYIKCLPPNVIEMIAMTLGDTNNGLTGTEIHRLLLQSNIEDIDESNTKWKRLFNAFAENLNKLHCSNQILNFIKNALAPSRFINNPERFRQLLSNVNIQLAFVGFELKENGQYREITAAETISDVQIKVLNFPTSH